MMPTTKASLYTVTKMASEKQWKVEERKEQGMGREEREIISGVSSRFVNSWKILSVCWKRQRTS